MNSFPYFFAEMYFTFALPIMDTQYDATKMSPADGRGIYDQVPIPTPEQPQSRNPENFMEGGIWVNNERFT